jgi:hypothetical protein
MPNSMKDNIFFFADFGGERAVGKPRGRWEAAVEGMP